MRTAKENQERGSLMLITKSHFNILMKLSLYKKLIWLAFITSISGGITTSKADDMKINEIQTVQQLKTQIIALAQSFQGQGDPDYSKQMLLEALVSKLLDLNPQPPVKERLNILYGVWKQVWGPYDYKSEDSRGIDPELGIAEIYQSVFAGGYYYNISPLYKKGDHNQERTGYLRGEFELDDEYPNRINVHFTRYPGINGRPTDGIPIWKLAPQAENDQLENEITIVPWIIVQLFFGTGSLDEVYTDQDLRITFGSNGKPKSKKAIYIMTRVQ